MPKEKISQRKDHVFDDLGYSLYPFRFVIGPRGGQISLIGMRPIENKLTIACIPLQVVHALSAAFLCSCGNTVALTETVALETTFSIRKARHLEPNPVPRATPAKEIVERL